jgi:hypothetical protein
MNDLKFGLVAALAMVAVSCGGGPTGPSKLTVNGTVKSFDGTPASGITVQIGDATNDNRVQTQTDATGKFTAPDVQTPYTITAIPPTLIEQLPVSFKEVSRADPTLVLQAPSGQTKPCNKAEAYIRYRLGGSSVVDPSNIGYMYYLAEGIHEDSLLSNAVSILRPGQRGGYVRVLFSNAPCKTQVTGSLVYLERGPNGYSVAGKLDGVEANTGTATPSSANPYVVTVASSGSASVSGEVSIPTGYDAGVVLPVLKVGKASVLLSDPRDLVAVNKASATGNKYGFNLPPSIAGVSYRVGAFVSGSFHTGWFYSEPLVTPLPTAGVTQAVTIANIFQNQEPSGNILDNVTPKFAWTPTSPANLYHVVLFNTNCSDAVWTGVSVTSTSFTLPRLPQPARLDIGTSAVPCNYSWAALNAMAIRDEPLTADKLLDGRLVLKRYYSLQSSLNLQAILPVNFSPTSAVDTPGSLANSQFAYREEFLASAAAVAVPIKPSGFSSTTPTDPPSDVSAYLIPAAGRAGITTAYSTNNVGPFNNPDEIGAGVVNIKVQTFQTQPK